MQLPIHVLRFLFDTKMIARIEDIFGVIAFLPKPNVLSFFSPNGNIDANFDAFHVLASMIESINYANIVSKHELGLIFEIGNKKYFTRSLNTSDGAIVYWKNGQKQIQAMSEITYQKQEEILLRNGKYENINSLPFEDAFLIIGQESQKTQKLINNASKIIESNCTKITKFEHHELSYLLFRCDKQLKEIAVKYQDKLSFDLCFLSDCRYISVLPNEITSEKEDKTALTDLIKDLDALIPVELQQLKIVLFLICVF